MAAAAFATAAFATSASLSTSLLPPPPSALAFAPPLSRRQFSGTPSVVVGRARIRSGSPPLSSSSEDDGPTAPVPSSETSPDAGDVGGENEMNPADLDPMEYFASLPGGGNDFSAADDDSNAWISTEDTSSEGWEEVVKKRMDGSVWTEFASSEDGDGEEGASKENVKAEHESGDDGEAAWLDTLASITAEEIEFNLQEADRADKVRQMQEWGFDSDSISSTLGVATDEELEVEEDNEVFEAFKEVTAESGFGMYVGDDEDMSEVESHTRVERDEDTGEPVRTQMVYVDEHTCIGCTNCAMIAQSTFFMDGEHGRARVFQQWGDDDDTIQVAIETCPVDCIHYVPYEELVRLEVERRDQNINFKARLVNQGELGGTAHNYGYGGGGAYTAPQKISGNMASRCNNCPTRGCKNCPMYGIGENPEFKRKEKERKARRALKLMQERMESENKSVDL